MRLVCEVCGSHFTVSADDRKFFTVDAPTLCSIGCIEKYVTLLGPVPEASKKYVYKMPRDMMEEGEVYSPLLHMKFRSELEAMMAETIAFKWRVEAEYEPHRIPVLQGRFYVPDFFVNRRCWLEVKGEWLSAGKKKFKEAQKLLGRERLVLVPERFRRELQSIARDLGRVAA